MTKTTYKDEAEKQPGWLKYINYRNPHDFQIFSDHLFLFSVIFP